MLQEQSTGLPHIQTYIVVFYVARLEKEAAILRTLNHPNIIGFRGFTKTVQDGPKNLVMEDGNESLGKKNDDKWIFLDFDKHH